MHRLAFAAFAALALAGPGIGQTRIVTQVLLTYVDTVSLTNVTTITLGESIQWLWTTGNHSVTSGTGSADPASGALFDSCLDAPTPTFTYTPTSVGTIPYYCIPHEAMSHNGTIIVLPPSATYPGTNEDLELASSVSTPGGPFNTPQAFPDVKQASPGDVLSIVARSPMGTFDYVSYGVVGDLFTTGGPPPFPLGPGIQVGFSAFIVVGFNGPIGLAPVIQPGGTANAFIVPPGLSGSSLILQGLVIGPIAANGFYASTAGQEIQLL